MATQTATRNDAATSRLIETNNPLARTTIIRSLLGRKQELEDLKEDVEREVADIDITLKTIGAENATLASPSGVGVGVGGVVGVGVGGMAVLRIGEPAYTEENHHHTASAAPLTDRPLSTSTLAATTPPAVKRKPWSKARRAQAAQRQKAYWAAKRKDEKALLKGAGYKKSAKGR